MTDRELLERAAKAAGYAVEFPPTESAYACWAADSGSEYLYWNPLTDDGDAFRLAVKLRIDLMHATDDNNRMVLAEPPSEDGAREWTGRDPYAATRRAIVRAAAEIGGQS